MTELTADERRVLSGGFRGPRPGSNFFPLLCVEADGVQVIGERLEELHRAGLLIAVPRIEDTHHEIKGGNAGPYGEIPDIELTHDYDLNDGPQRGGAMSIKNAMNDPQVERLVKQGFDAFGEGKSYYESPFPPSHENYWWHRGWDVAACAAHLSAREQR